MEMQLGGFQTQFLDWRRWREPLGKKPLIFLIKISYFFGTLQVNIVYFVRSCLLINVQP